MKRVAAVRCGFDGALTVIAMAIAARLDGARDWQGAFSFSFIAAMLLADFLFHVREAVMEDRK